LLKSTIAIRGMERYALAVMTSLENDNLDSARTNLSMIVKRNTSNLDKNHVISGVLESISENTVDGITGPLFYYAILGLPGAFVYRVINTADSMIGYKSDMFKNIGWFAATCDTILNYVPSRLTGLIMIISAAILQNNWKESYKIMLRDGKKTASPNAGYPMAALADTILNYVPSRLTGLIMIISAAILQNNWKESYKIMLRDGKKTASPNAGYPMAALAGALETKFEKLEHYSLGDVETTLTKQHVLSAITIMKLTSILFFGIITIPIIIALSFVGWWIHA